MIEKIFSITEDESGVPIDAKCVGELVRCRDCKYSSKGTIDGVELMCGYPWAMTSMSLFVEKNHYCSKGERKDGEK